MARSRGGRRQMSEQRDGGQDDHAGKSRPKTVTNCGERARQGSHQSSRHKKLT